MDTAISARNFVGRVRVTSRISTASTIRNLKRIKLSHQGNDLLFGGSLHMHVLRWLVVDNIWRCQHNQSQLQRNFGLLRYLFMLSHCHILWVRVWTQIIIARFWIAVFVSKGETRSVWVQWAWYRATKGNRIVVPIWSASCSRKRTTSRLQII